jgi:rhodanese-related sulfurtransferase
MGAMTTPGPAPEVDVHEARQRRDAGAVLLDVRNPDEWSMGRAPGAIWIPMGELDARQDEIPTDREIVVICKMGGRSARVAAALNAAGYHAWNVTGGLEAWHAAGLDVVDDDGRPGAVA